LGYQYANRVVDTSNWPDEVRGFLDGSVIVLAERRGGSGSLDVIYVPLAPADLDQVAHASRVAERTIVYQLLKEHPLALFVFSEPTKLESHLVNVRYHADTAQRRTLRRITVDPLGRLGITAQQVARLALVNMSPLGDSSVPLDTQRHHDLVFDVEAVSREFLEACTCIFQNLLADFLAEPRDASTAYDSALRFLCRLVVVYFFQEHGWLGNDPHFMVGLWRAYCEGGGQGNTFVSEWLDVLFSWLFCERPMLQGGAWSRLPQATRLELATAPRLGPVLDQCVGESTYGLLPMSDARFEELLRLLEAQRYAIREPTPLDQEVALDPAVIGLLHENLAFPLPDMAAADPGDVRHLRGMFYTPPAEIDLMCRLSLVDWLSNHLGAEHKPDLYRVVFATDAREREQADKVWAARKMWSPLRSLLQEVKVLDPACGAGAFLVGMHSVLDDLLFRAATRLKVEETAIERKQRIIQRSLYGVDVMDQAIEAVRLRLFLHLTSDRVGPSEAGRLAAQLTGLAANARCGDSLLGGLDDLIAHPQETARHHTRGVPEDSEHALGTGFDIVIGNPPYVRQELIRDPSTAGSGEDLTSSQSYKSRISHAVCCAWPRTFGYESETDQARWRLEARSDLYVYFYLQGLSRLNSKGVLCFLTSSAWLDAKYGRDLRKFLATKGEVRLIVGNSAQRSFPSAEVNTIIGLFGSATDAVSERPESLDHVARFVTLAIPFDQVLCPSIWEQVQGTERYHATREWRAWAVRQAELLDEGRVPEGRRTLGDRWGGQYLRAPHIYWVLEDRYREKLKRVGEIAEVRRGVTTGANHFFFLDEQDLVAWEIEDEFLVPALKSPRGQERVWLEGNGKEFSYVFVCHSERDELRGTGAWDYIRYGESLGYHLRPTCASRRRWYDLGQCLGASVHANYLVDQVMRFFASERPLLAGDSFQEIHCAMEPTLVAAACSSAICQLSVNVLGRSNFGGGLLKVQTYEVRDLLIPNPALLGREAERSFQGAGLLALDGHDRRVLDGIVFDALGLTTGERGAVYEALFDLVAKRLTKARRSVTAGAFGGAEWKMER
jgi:hypothetical protein